MSSKINQAQKSITCSLSCVEVPPNGQSIEEPSLETRKHIEAEEKNVM